MNERTRILDLLASGKITVDEAERLLQAVSAEAAAHEARSSDDDASALPKGSARFLRVKIDSQDGEKVNIRVPLALLKAGLKLKKLLPTKAQANIKFRTDSGVDFDLDDLAGKPVDEIVEILRELSIDIDGKDGETVKVFCE
jgi:hypothetical protein